ncbi:HTH DNA binding domain protein [Mycobacterium phage Sheen]|uniref:HTH DNA binding domain protein n=1 Tax=Mycobacterium phage Sheen TaxID=1589274 RepID=A0A0B5A472_9CAUD|nr:HTH DNA binding protein [Mycobacterium phage Sheen]AJD82465.1 HTH DNA binding domain protein [Mycobacterium phage Sheen]
MSTATDPLTRLEATVREMNDALQALLKQGKPAPVEITVHNNKPKLSRQDAEHIRGLVRQGYKQAEVARAYDVHHATVSRIVRGVYYR